MDAIRRQIHSINETGAFATLGHHVASPGGPPVSCVLSPDRRRLTITKVDDGVKVTFTLGWAFDPSDELVATAIEHFRQLPISDGDVVGQKLRLKRLGPIGIEWETGPPTWWLPRLKVEGGHRWHVRLGWLRLAVGIWRFGEQDAR
jgi:hypothetical protein